MSEVELLTDAIESGADSMSVSAAESVLEWRFSVGAQERLLNLLERHNRGELSDSELAELDRFRRFGMLVDLVQARARQVLQAHQQAG